MARSRVELFEQIRRDWRAGEVSVRELAVRHHVHRRTVRQALTSAVHASAAAMNWPFLSCTVLGRRTRRVVTVTFSWPSGVGEGVAAGFCVFGC